MPTIEITLRPRTLKAPPVDGNVDLVVVKERIGRNKRRRRVYQVPGLGSAGDLALEAIRCAIDHIITETDETGTPPPFARTRR